MEIPKTTNLTGSAPTTPKSTLDRDAFLRLLVTQLQNQDPLDPMDAREMVTQLSELTGVEKLESIEAQLGALQIASAGIANVQASGLVGRTVTADLSSLRVEETGNATGAYTLAGRAQSVTITIYDADGNALRTIERPGGAAGSHTYEWDGLDDEGNRVPPGRYRVELEATGESGAPVEARSEVRGMVTSVTYDGGYPELRIGDTRVLLGDVKSIEA
jgi:flagellar basal-body rod modification protein FlgD